MHVKAKGMQVRLHLRYVGGMLETSVIVMGKMALRKPKVMWLSGNLMPDGDMLPQWGCLCA